MLFYLSRFVHLVPVIPSVARQVSSSLGRRNSNSIYTVKCFLHLRIVAIRQYSAAQQAESYKRWPS